MNRKDKLYAIENLRILDKGGLIELLKKQIKKDKLNIWKFLFNDRPPIA